MSDSLAAFNLIQINTNIKRLKHSSFFINLFSVAGANILSKLIGLITLGYAARVLGPENYGIYAFGLSILAYAGIILSPGLITWGNREIARDKSKAGSTFIIVTGTRLVLALFGFLGVVAFAHFWLEGMQRWVVILCGFTIFANAFNVDWVLNGMELMRIPAYFGILSSTLNVIGLFSIIHSSGDIYYLPLIGIVISFLISLILLGIIIFRFAVKVKIPNWTEWKRAIINAIPLSIMSALVVVLHYTNNIIVKVYAGNEALGVFYSAYKLVEYAGMLPGILMVVFLPRLSRLVVENNKMAKREAMLMARTHMFFAFLVGTLFLVEAESIVSIIYGKSYIESVLMLKVMSIAVIFNYAIIGYTNCLISFGKDKVMIMVVTVSVIMSVGGGFILVPKLGAFGAAIVITLIDFSGWLVSLPYYKNTIGSLQLNAWVTPLIAGAVMGTLLLIMQNYGYPYWIRIPIGILSYSPFVIINLKEVLYS